MIKFAQRRGVGVAVVLLFCALDSALSEEGGGWTNLAGHVLRATPQSIQGQTITFKEDGTGKTVEYPLSLFPPLEQERLRNTLKETTIPEGLQSAYEFSGRILKRTRLLYENGQMSDADYQKSIAVNLSAFRAKAAPLVEQQKLSPARLELILSQLIDSAK